MNPTRTKHDLGNALVRALQTLRNATDDVQRTQRLRDVASLTVDLREHFLTPKGEPDWAARTWPYREFVRERYSEAGYAGDELKSTQAAVRYHVSRMVRERLSPETIEDLGLQKESSVDRSREKRGVTKALLAAAREIPEGQTNADLIRSLGAALLVLERVDEKAVAELGEREKAQARTVLRKVRERAASLADAAGGAG
ncbi:hypothetical protein [Micromonospora sp. NPDC023956]|uniref:hypothetical protein n=1 Tax=Micromonospora sp. NPDC023956 TaxID=3155722 RepID=UPI0033FD8EFB